MQINFDDNSLLSLLLFGIFFISLSRLELSSKSEKKLNLIPPPKHRYRAYHLACLLEDAPASALTGQVCLLATPLMTPFACVVPELWQLFYRDNLGKPRINYWHWVNQPEVNNICPELTNLLSLTCPQGYIKDVLESLAQGKNILLEPQNLSPENLQTYHYTHFAFKQWHYQAENKIGIEQLKSIYQVCYQTEWEVIQQILDDKILSITPFLYDLSAPWWKVLGVHPQADTAEVEKAYKTLLRNWHPDLNKHPHATEVTARLNLAYEQYQNFLEAAEKAKLKYKPWLKIKDWFANNQN